MFLKTYTMESDFVGDLLGSQYLFEILQASLTAKNSENMVKSGCFEKRLRWRVCQFLFSIKAGCKVFFVKILIYR